MKTFLLNLPLKFKLFSTALLTCILVFCILNCGGNGGNPPPISDALITASVSAGTSAGLKLAIKDENKQHVIAKYLNNYAGALRTISGNPTDDQLTQQLTAFIPPDVQSEYPELGSFAVPIIVSFYHWAQSKYGSDAAQFQKVLNDVATGIETGSSCCLK